MDMRIYHPLVLLHFCFFMVPDPTFAFVRGLCCPALDFVHVICFRIAIMLSVREYSSPARLKFSNVGQRSRSRPQSQYFLYKWKGLITRNTHMKFERLTCLC